MRLHLKSVSSSTKQTSTYVFSRNRAKIGCQFRPVLVAFMAFMFTSLSLLSSAQEIEEVTVTGTADYFSIIPNEDSDGAFGLSKSLLETPRSITTVSEDLIEKFALRSVDDMVRLTPGAFTSSFFGIRGAMDIRGEPADNYYRGFKRIANPGAFNTIVRGAEKLEVYRGPVSPLYGSGSVGGQLNYIPKSAKVDGDVFVSGIGGSVDLTIGSYSQKIFSADFGMPFQIGDKEAGFHIFAEVEDSGSFFDEYEPSSDLVQIAFDVNLSDSTRLEFGGQYQTSDSIQVPGWNRITQDLIDNGTYITGAPRALNSSNPIGIDSLLPQESSFIAPFAPDFLNNAFSSVGSFCSGAATGTGNATYRGNEVSCPGGFGDFLSDRTLENPFALTDVGTTQLDHSTTFIDELDYADSTAITLYADITHELETGAIWKTELFYDYLDHTKYQSWGFTAYYPGVDTIELRTSYKFDYEFESGISAETIVGANYRYEDLELYHAFFDETFDFRDISVGPTPDDRISPAVFDPYENAEITRDIDGNPTGLTGTVERNFNEVQFSTTENLGAFFLTDVSVEKFNLLFGGRYDEFDVESEDGWVTYLGNPRSTGVLSDSQSAFSYNVSASYLTDSGWAPYVTVSESNSLSTNQLGGIIPGTVDSGEYLQESTLSEIGVKFDGFDGMIYSALSYFDQEKSFRDGQTGALIEVAGKGVEFEIRALVTDNLSILGTATHSETTEISDGALAVINGAEFALENGLNPEDVYGGRIAGTRAAFLGSGVELDRGGLPDNILSLYGTWNQPLGDAELTGSLGFTWVDETYTDAFETILLPSYMVWTASTSYVNDRFTALLQVNNLLDEEYYTSADLFDSVVVKPSEGRTLSLTLSYAFGE